MIRHIDAFAAATRAMLHAARRRRCRHFGAVAILFTRAADISITLMLRVMMR